MLFFYVLWRFHTYVWLLGLSFYFHRNPYSRSVFVCFHEIIGQLGRSYIFLSFYRNPCSCNVLVWRNFRKLGLSYYLNFILIVILFHIMFLFDVLWEFPRNIRQWFSYRLLIILVVVPVEVTFLFDILFRFHTNVELLQFL